MNHKMKDTNFDKGFVQGIITATIGTGDKATLPQGYVKALEKLSRHKNITIITPNEEGDVIILATNIYNKKKIQVLLHRNPNTYEKIQEHHIPEIRKFNKSTKNQLPVMRDHMPN